MKTFNQKHFLLEEYEIQAFKDLLRKFMIETLKLAPKSVRVNGRTLTYEHININVVVYNPSNDFYFRLTCKNGKKEIVVARIGFKNPRKGLGTQLIKELCSFGKAFDYTFLSIECPNEGCQKFMKKLGFENNQFQIKIEKLIKYGL